MVYSQQIERRIQHKFLSSAGFKLSIIHPPHDYGPVLQKLNLLSLADRRLARDLTIFQNILRGETDSPSLQHANFKIPASPTRNITPRSLYLPSSNTNYLNNEPLTRCTRQANHVTTFSHIN